MIQLSDDCLIFSTSGGEGVPFSAEMISVELLGDAASMVDPEFIKHAATAVFHYFREDLGRETVSVAEFSEALEKVLRGFKLKPEVPAMASEPAGPRVAQSDLARLVSDADRTCELLFFPRLRDELREQLKQGPHMLCFRGLRDCVMQLAGARRWSTRCQQLHDQIVEFLRSCMSRDNAGTSCALVVK